MEHDIYYERQRALIERSLAAEQEREMLQKAIRAYKREKASSKAYRRLQNTKRGKIVRNSKTIPCWKGNHNTMTKGSRDVMRTRRFPNSHITVCYRTKAY